MEKYVGEFEVIKNQIKSILKHSPKRTSYHNLEVISNSLFKIL